MHSCFASTRGCASFNGEDEVIAALLPSERPEPELTVPSLFFLLLPLLEFKRHRESVAERRDGDMLWRMTASVV